MTKPNTDTQFILKHTSYSTYAGNHSHNEIVNQTSLPVTHHELLIDNN
jgi:hypothetical protein